MAKYDYLIVGCGLFGSVFARQMADAGRKVGIIEKRTHIGGNCFTETVEDIEVHKYGPHIFHTNDKNLWLYINKFAEFNYFINRPKVFYKGKIYSFPINLLTLHQLWAVTSPKHERPTSLVHGIIGDVECPLRALFDHDLSRIEVSTRNPEAFFHLLA